MRKTTDKLSPELRQRAVRLVRDSEGQHGSRWQAVTSISARIGCSGHMREEWVKKAEVDSGPSEPIQRGCRIGRVFEENCQFCGTRRGMGLAHHSDRGRQSLSIRSTELLAEAGIAPPAGSVGDSSDTALAETAPFQGTNGFHKPRRRLSALEGKSPLALEPHGT